MIYDGENPEVRLSLPDDEEIVLPVERWIQTMQEKCDSLLERYDSLFRHFSGLSTFSTIVRDWGGTEYQNVIDICQKSGSWKEFIEDTRTFYIGVRQIHEDDPEDEPLPTFGDFITGNRDVMMEKLWLFWEGLPLLEKKLQIYEAEMTCREEE